MDAEDSASDRPHSSRRSRRESPSPKHEAAPGGGGQRERERERERERTSSRRSRSKRSLRSSTEERKKHTTTSRSREKQQPEDSDEPKSTHGTSAPGKSESSRYHKKRSRHRSKTVDDFLETPVTRVLREMPDDILDTPAPNTYGSQYAYYVDGDTEQYGIQKGRDCVYVEHYDGFSSVPRCAALAENGGHSDTRWFDLSTATALDVAIAVQKLWLPLADFCHGLLAGLAMMQAIVVDRLLGSSPEEAINFVLFYCHFSLIFTTTFFLLTSLCLVSIFDRLDLARGDWPYLVDLLSVRPQIPWLLIPIYAGGLILALAAAKGDDFLHLSQYNISNDTVLKETDVDLLHSWHVLNSLRCACVVVGWLLISVSHPPDLLLNLLVEMLPHQNTDGKAKTKGNQSNSH
ncbi:Transmembrane protein 237 [Frankliniella fusca]|uniref:Transmembrane protein 237 n=1 Tax=Frankliniella fusca TaxID=407009 RepID=A0AAE1HRS1_9NEOP|nr:Transmembrane protein 237 [Frankliniella fusca]